MEDILASVRLDNKKSIHIAALARQTIIESGATHLGFDGYFIFETNDDSHSRGISVLGKATSIEAAFRMIDIWSMKATKAA
ncbi:hypothetical protein [Martelella sp. HB161492]|uniref:hypothetical protein n=1 Tax=Martelella sp. HB161492 TaxID=2720726 RepID=UPI00158F9EB0|nr:hypothetical protein [Martelella sp. HB161492]